MNYKAETTLNERDSLTDLFLAERLLLKLYADYLSLGCSKGFLTLAKNQMLTIEKDRLSVFMLMTERDLIGVNSCDEERKYEIIDRFKTRINSIK